MIQVQFPSTFSTPCLGLDIVILNENNRYSKEGEIYIIPPSFGLSTILLNRNHFKIYYNDCPSIDNYILRRHGDYFVKLENGYFKAKGRSDDCMNLGGIKVSSKELEQVIESIDGIREVAAIACKPREGGPDN